ncbi:hypothetical protein HYS10_01210, partial [Candidatus Collierbacteria bacterium]|nr:hypothetical protein [Candidatus Collierbacteria bacterium]
GEYTEAVRCQLEKIPWEHGGGEKIDLEKSLSSVARIDFQHNLVTAMDVVLSVFENGDLSSNNSGERVDIFVNDRGERLIFLSNAPSTIVDAFGLNKGKPVEVFSGRYPFGFMFSSSVMEQSGQCAMLRITLQAMFDKILKGEIWLSYEIKKELERVGWFFVDDGFCAPIAFQPKGREKSQIYLPLGLIYSREFIGELAHELNHMFNHRRAGGGVISPTLFEYNAFDEEVATMKRNFPEFNIFRTKKALDFYVAVIRGDDLHGQEAHFVENYRRSFVDLIQRLDFERRVWLMEQVAAVTGDELV